MAESKYKKESLPQESHQRIDITMLDNLVDNDAILADNAPKTELLLVDNTPSKELLLADSTIQASNVADTEDKQTDNSVKVEISEKFYISELKGRYKLKRAALYKRMEYLNITTWREGIKAYLNAEQIGHMDGLHEYMKTSKEMEGYPKPQPTGPKEKEEHSTSPFETQASEKFETNRVSAITVQQSNIQQSNINEELADNYEPEPLPVKAEVGESEMEKIDIQAQILAATRYVVTE